MKKCSGLVLSLLLLAANAWSQSHLPDLKLADGGIFNRLGLAFRNIPQLKVRVSENGDLADHWNPLSPEGGAPRNLESATVLFHEAEAYLNSRGETFCDRPRRPELWNPCP